MLWQPESERPSTSSGERNEDTAEYSLVMTDLRTMSFPLLEEDQHPSDIVSSLNRRAKPNLETR